MDQDGSFTFRILMAHDGPPIYDGFPLSSSAKGDFQSSLPNELAKGAFWFRKCSFFGFGMAQILVEQTTKVRQF